MRTRAREIVVLAIVAATLAVPAVSQAAPHTVAPALSVVSVTPIDGTKVTVATPSITVTTDTPPAATSTIAITSDTSPQTTVNVHKTSVDGNTLTATLTQPLITGSYTATADLTDASCTTACQPVADTWSFSVLWARAPSPSHLACRPHVLPAGHNWVTISGRVKRGDDVRIYATSAVDASMTVHKKVSPLADHQWQAHLNVGAFPVGGITFESYAVNDATLKPSIDTTTSTYSSLRGPASVLTERAVGGPKSKPYGPTRMVSYGHRVTIRGRLTDRFTGKGVGGKTIEIDRTTLGGAQPPVAGTAVTNAKGGWSIRPKEFASSKYRAVFTGDTTYLPSHSPISSVPAKYSIRILTPNDGKTYSAKRPLRVRGVVSPAAPGHGVQVSWGPAAKADPKYRPLYAKLNKNSEFTTKLRPKAGTGRVIVTFGRLIPSLNSGKTSVLIHRR